MTSPPDEQLDGVDLNELLFGSGAPALTSHAPVVSPASLPLVLSASQVRNLPPPKWLVQDLLVSGSLVTLFGEPETYKSFIALDLALCVATGSPWCERPVQQGSVMYISGEGLAGLPQRVRAWEDVRGVVVPDQCRFTADARVLRPEHRRGRLEAFLARLSRPTALIVVDTLSRCLFDLDENSTSDMAEFVSTLDDLRLETGAVVLVLHHMSKRGRDIRGSTVLPAASDTEIKVSRPKTSQRVTLTCEKQKDAAKFATFSLIGREHTTAGGTSLVLEQTRQASPSTQGASSASRAEVQRKAWLDMAYKILSSGKALSAAGILTAWGTKVSKPANRTLRRILPADPRFTFTTHGKEVRFGVRT